MQKIYCRFQNKHEELIYVQKLREAYLASLGEGQRQLTSKVQGQMHHNGCLVSINGNAWRVEQILFFV